MDGFSIENDFPTIDNCFVSIKLSRLNEEGFALGTDLPKLFNATTNMCKRQSKIFVYYIIMLFILKTW